jgi:hypothetical protein
MTKTLILIFPPDLNRSKANATIAAAAVDLPGVEVVDMQALYPSGQIDVDAEVQRLLSADRLVLQFPVQWYSTPPLLKAWQEAPSPAPRGGTSVTSCKRALSRPCDCIIVRATHHRHTDLGIYRSLASFPWWRCGRTPCDALER